MSNNIPVTNIYKNTDIISIEVPTPFPVGPVNLYLLLGEKITLVDTGPKTELAWKSFIYQLNKSGIRIKDIDHVVLTHHHVDHSGLSAILLEHHPNLKLFAHEATVPWIEKRSNVIEKMVEFYKELYNQHGLSINAIEEVKKFHNYFEQYTAPVKVNSTLNNGDVLEGNSDWIIIHNPGHASGHISIFNEKTGTLIAGDHLIEHTSSGIFIEPPINQSSGRSKSLVDYKNSLERIKELKVKQALSGHGNPITEVSDLIDQHLNKINYRLEKIKTYMGESSLTVFDILLLMYPERFEKYLPMYFSEILGALELLEEQGEVRSIREENLVKYRLITTTNNKN